MLLLKEPFNLEILPSTKVNAMFGVDNNKIMVPFAIMRRPIFDVDFPISAIYGGLGVILGHELTHGFDSEGIKYDEHGEQNEWMDEESKKGFEVMEKCVIKQYNNFKDANGTHVDGANTITENISDNGGKR